MAELQQATKGNRVHIGIFGRRNAGKSSLINRLTKQQIALVSEVAGTTTDPVYKAMELLPIGPIMVIDTAGIDDEGDLGKLRIGKTREVMGKTDVAIIVIDAAGEFSDFERGLLEDFRELGTPVLVVMNKCETVPDADRRREQIQAQSREPVYAVSAGTGEGFDQLREALIAIAPRAFVDRPLAGDLVSPGDTVVLCVPIDTAAPKGRLILPQVQVIRDLLDHDASIVISKERDLAGQLGNLKTPPALVITDSQVFAKANQVTPAQVKLTSFSILMARHKGDLESLVEGALAVDRLRPGDRILIAEACTHQCQVEDIGRVKIPNWLKKHVGGDIQIDWYTGDSFPLDVRQYKLVIHCGACMINSKAMLWRQRLCREQGVPIVNYGVFIAHVQGILPRVLSPIPELADLVRK